MSTRPALAAITERSAIELAAAIRRRELSATEVVDAHIARHQKVAPLINAIAADRYELARAAPGEAGRASAVSRVRAAKPARGSIRIPAFFGGVLGHKRSAGPVPHRGADPPALGESGRMLGTGPLARRAEDLMPLLRIIAGPDGVDRHA